MYQHRLTKWVKFSSTELHATYSNVYDYLMRVSLSQYVSIWVDIKSDSN